MIHEFVNSNSAREDGDDFEYRVRFVTRSDRYDPEYLQLHKSFLRSFFYISHFACNTKPQTLSQANGLEWKPNPRVRLKGECEEDWYKSSQIGKEKLSQSDSSRNLFNQGNKYFLSTNYV